MTREWLQAARTTTQWGKPLWWRMSHYDTHGIWFGIPKSCASHGTQSWHALLSQWTMPQEAKIGSEIDPVVTRCRVIHHSPSRVCLKQLSKTVSTGPLHRNDTNDKASTTSLVNGAQAIYERATLVLSARHIGLYISGIYSRFIVSLWRAWVRWRSHVWQWHQEWHTNPEGVIWSDKWPCVSRQCMTP